MIALLWKFRIEIISLFGAAMLALLAWHIYHRGAVDALNKVQVQNTQGALIIKEKQDEIRNHRPDVADLVDRLRAGTF